MEWLQAFSDRATEYGVLAFVLLYLVAATLPIPRWPLTVAAGAMFGFVGGVAVALIVSFLGAASAFFISRYLLRHSVEKLIARRPKLKAVDDAMREGGWKAVALLQMSPAVPFGLQNYFLGASKVKLRSYLIGTACTGLPSTLIYVGAGAGGRMLGSFDSGLKWLGLAAGLAVTIGLSMWISRLAKRRLAASI